MSRTLCLIAGALLLPLSPLAAQPVVDAATVRVTTQDIGAFPYVQAPAGFVAKESKTLSFEQKYVFPGGKVRTVEGPYHHATVYAAGGDWNETLLLSQLDKQITALGGARVFDGAMPQAAHKMVDDNAPRFVKDLYDINPYRFRQYLIRTPAKQIWIEMGYGYNADMIDLTVIEEPLPG